MKEVNSSWQGGQDGCCQLAQTGLGAASAGHGHASTTAPLPTPKTLCSPAQHQEKKCSFDYFFFFKKTTYILISVKLGTPCPLHWVFAAGRAAWADTCLGLWGHLLSRGSLCPEVLWLQHQHQQKKRPLRASSTAEGLWGVKPGGRKKMRLLTP